MVKCPYCDREPLLVKGDVIYPKRQDLVNNLYWLCKPCDAYVGCHGDSSRPMGRLANAELRQAKVKAHKVFDPLWKSGRMTRRQAYAWLATRLDIPRDQTHIGMFDVETCLKVVQIMKEGQHAP